MKQNHNKIIHRITDSIQQSEPNTTIFNDIMRAEYFKQHYSSFKETLNSLDVADKISFKQQFSICINKYENFSNGDTNRIFVDSVHSIKLGEGESLNEKQLEFLKDLDTVINKLSESNITPESLEKFYKLQEQIQKDPYFAQSLIENGKNLAEKSLLNTYPTYSESVSEFGNTLSVADIPLLSRILDASQISEGFTFVAIEHRMLLILGSTCLIYHAAFCLQQSSLSYFIDDVRKHIAMKVNFGFINIKGVNSFFKSDVGTNAAIFVVNNKPLCAFTLSMLIFGGLASFSPAELGQIVKETHLQIPEFNFNSDQYKFEDPKLNESYEEALQASKSVAFHVGKAVSGIMRALADGFYEPLKKTAEPIINILIDYINKK